MAMADTRISGDPFDPAEELTAFIAGLEGDGGVVSFVGLTRGASKTGAAVATLTLEYYDRVTEASIKTIAADALARFAVSQLRIVHRYGTLRAGEPIVFVAASAPHRRVAFEAADYLMDRLKTEAVFWKREDKADGAVWIEPTAADYAARDRWNERMNDEARD